MNLSVSSLGMNAARLLTQARPAQVWGSISQGLFLARRRESLLFDNFPELSRRSEFEHKNQTMLSANLIECAASGQADERLLLALDGIMTDVPQSDRCISLLLSWGHSSGVNAFLGMALAVLCSLQQMILENYEKTFSEEPL